MSGVDDLGRCFAPSALVAGAREFELATGELRWESELVDPWLGPGGGTRVGALSPTCRA